MSGMSNARSDLVQHCVSIQNLKEMRNKSVRILVIRNMKTRILIAAVTASFISATAFGQDGVRYSQPQSQPPQPSNAGQPRVTTTTTKTTSPQGVKGYLDQQLATSKDKKFHVSLNGKDVALAPVNFHGEKKLGGSKTSEAVDMKAADGKIYEIDFVLSDNQVTGASVGKFNGQKQ
jgi:hypothetical protein